MRRKRWEGDERRGEKWKGKKIGEGRVGMRGSLVNTCERLCHIPDWNLLSAKKRGIQELDVNCNEG